MMRILLGIGKNMNPYGRNHHQISIRTFWMRTTLSKDWPFPAIQKQHPFKSPAFQLPHTSSVAAKPLVHDQFKGILPRLMGPWGISPSRESRSQPTSTWKNQEKLFSFLASCSFFKRCQLHDSNEAATERTPVYNRSAHRHATRQQAGSNAQHHLGEEVEFKWTFSDWFFCCYVGM